MSYITDNQAINLAQAVINDLQEELLDSFGTVYNLTTPEFIRLATERTPSYMKDIGLAAYIYIQDGMGQRRQKEAMEWLASRMEEKLGQGPYQPIQFIPSVDDIKNAFKEEMESFDFGLFPDLGIEIAKDVVGGLADSVEYGAKVVGSVGEKTVNLVETTLDSSSEAVASIPKMLPWILGAATLVVTIIGVFYVKGKK